MWRWLMVIMIPLLIGGKLSAQESSPTVEYRLRVPAVHEFIAAIPSVWMAEPMLSSNSAQLEFERQLRILLIEEFNARYFDEVDAETLSKAYEQLNGGFNVPAIYYEPFLDLVAWNMEIVQRALAENKIHLPDTGIIHFNEYEINVKKYDFDSDGVYEWVLDVQLGNPRRFIAYWMAQQDSSFENGYRFTEVPISFRHVGFYPLQDNSLWLNLSVPNFRDVTGDGIVEWIASANNLEPLQPPIGANHTYYLLGWRNNQWEVLTTQNRDGEIQPDTLRMFVPFDEINYGWAFENIDDDAALELVQYQEPYDGRFDCERIAVNIYDWDGTAYVLSQEINRANLSNGCLSRALYDANYQLQRYIRQIYTETMFPQTQEARAVSNLHIDRRQRLDRVYGAWGNLDAVAVEAEINAMLTDPISQDLDSHYFSSFAQYYHAMILDELGRDDEALAQYVAIYESEPDSAMGILARLHFEDVQ